MQDLQRRDFLQGAGAMAAFAALPGMAQQETRFPEKPIKIMCGFGVGGGTDVVARVIAQKLQASWGQGVVVENRAGAGGVIATDAVAKASPDGYTMGIVAISHSFNATYYKKLPYDTLKDFVGITLVADVPNVLVADPSLRIKNMRDLIEYTRSRPGKVNFASAGESSASYINAELFNMAAGIKPMHVPFKTMPDALMNVISGNVQFVFSSIPAATTLIRGDRLTALAVSTKQRSAALPEVPSMSEAGMPDFDFSTWYGLIAPAGTPLAIKQKISREVSRILTLREVQEMLLTQGATSRSSTPEQFDTVIQQDVVRMAKLIKSVGIAQQ